MASLLVSRLEAKRASVAESQESWLAAAQRHFLHARRRKPHQKQAESTGARFGQALTRCPPDSVCAHEDWGDKRRSPPPRRPLGRLWTRRQGLALNSPARVPAAEQEPAKASGRAICKSLVWDRMDVVPFPSLQPPFMHSKAGHQAIHTFLCPWTLRYLCTYLHHQPTYGSVASCPSAGKSNRQAVWCCSIQHLSASVSVPQVCAHQRAAT